MKLRNILLTLTAAAALAVVPQAFASGNHHHGGHGNHGNHGNHGQQAERTADGVGEIRSVAEDGQSVVLHHEPIRALRWPAMTMELKLADPELAAGLEPGTQVEFTLRQIGTTDYEIIQIEPAHGHSH